MTQAAMTSQVQCISCAAELLQRFVLFSYTHGQKLLVPFNQRVKERKQLNKSGMIKKMIPPKICKNILTSGTFQTKVCLVINITGVFTHIISQSE